MDEDIGVEMTMLILDDEKDLCDFSKRFFEKRGFVVHTSLTTKDAINKINKTKFDIALLDQHMNNGSGLDVLKALREKQPQCQCIMLTVEDNKEIIANAKKMGAVEYLFKPSILTDIEKTINKVVKKIKGKGK